MFVDLDDVPVDAKCVIEMKGKSKADLAQYIMQTYQEDWVDAYKLLLASVSRLFFFTCGVADTCFTSLRRSKCCQHRL